MVQITTPVGIRFSVPENIFNIPEQRKVIEDTCIELENFLAKAHQNNFSTEERMRGITLICTKADLDFMKNSEDLKSN